MNARRRTPPRAWSPQVRAHALRDRIVALFGAFLVLGLLFAPSPGEAQTLSPGCSGIQAGGYPFVQNGCLTAPALNLSLEWSTGPSPPQNALGAGAGYGKVWLDTSVNPYVVRLCVASPCSTTFSQAQWTPLFTVNPTSGLASLASPLGSSALVTLTVSGTTASTSPTTGAIVDAGGLGVGGAINVGSTTQSTSAATGSVVTAGGLGVGGNLYVGGAAAIVSPAESPNTVYAGPASGMAAAASFRALVPADLNQTVQVVTTTGTVAITGSTVVWEPTSAAATTLTLPPSPAVGEAHRVSYGFAGTGFALTVTPGGSQTIGAGALSSLVLTYPDQSVTLTYAGGGRWQD